MKERKRLLFFVLLLSCIGGTLWAQDTPVQITNSAAGALKTALEAHADATNLQISGPMNGEDFAALRALQKVTVLDLSDVEIVEGGGYPAGYDDVQVEANHFPGYFCFDSPITNTLEEITLPIGTTHMDRRALQNAEKLTVVNLPEGLTHIGELAFGYCSALEEIDLPEGLQVIGSSAFDSCSALDGIDLPESLQSLGSYAFKNAASLSYIEIPFTIDSIKTSTFEKCIGLREIKLNPMIRFIGNYAFRGCTALEGIDLPIFLRSLGRECFKDCSELSRVVFAESGLDQIADGMFQNCISLAEISLPADVKTIGGNAFLQCESLTQVVLPAKLEVLMGGALAKTAITEVVLPHSLQEVNYAAFGHCTQLERVRLGSAVLKIAESAFGGCTALKWVEATAPKPFSATEEDRMGLVDLGQIEGLTLYVPKGSLDSYRQAEGWKEITEIKEGSAPYTFTVSEDNSLESQLSTIENLADVAHVILLGELGEATTESLRDLPRLSVLDLSKATLLEGFELNQFASLQEVCLPQSYTEVDPWLLSQSPALHTVKLSESTTSLGEGAFAFCPALKTIDLPNTLTTIDGEVFEGCASLTSLALPQEVSTVAPHLFSGCTGLKTITLGEQIDEIEEESFLNCLQLQEVMVPKSVTEIKDFAFRGCDALQRILLPSEEPAVVDATAFDETHYSNVTLVVGSDVIKQAYQAAEVWTLFSLYEIDPSLTSVASLDHALSVMVWGVEDGIRILNPTNRRLPVQVYSLTGELITQSWSTSTATLAVPEGQFVVRVGNDTFKVVVF